QVSREFLLRLRVWFAAHGDDPEAERAAVERLLEYSPGDAAALERLAVLEIRAGRADRAAAWRARQAEPHRARPPDPHPLGHALRPGAAGAPRRPGPPGRRSGAQPFAPPLWPNPPEEAAARAPTARLGSPAPPPPAPARPRPLAELIPDRPGTRLRSNPVAL